MECDKCNDDKFILIGCCSGRECGCLGLPIDAKPCDKCNADGLKEPSESIKKAFHWFFGVPSNVSE